MQSSPAKRLKSMFDSVNEGDLGIVLNFVPFTRIQVLWSVTGDNHVEEDKWWDAIVVGKTAQSHTLPKHEGEEEEENSIEKLPVYQIRYEPFPPDFPNPSIAEICILDDHFILDIENDSSLPWRHSGSTWEPSESDDEDRETEEVERDIPESILKEIKKLEETGVKIEGEKSTLSPDVCENIAREFVEKLINDLTSKHARELKVLPMSGQMAIADNVLKIREKLVSKVANCLSSTGCLSADDAERIVEELKSN